MDNRESYVCPYLTESEISMYYCSQYVHYTCEYIIHVTRIMMLLLAEHFVAFYSKSCLQ